MSHRLSRFYQHSFNATDLCTTSSSVLEPSLLLPRSSSTVPSTSTSSSALTNPEEKGSNSQNTVASSPSYKEQDQAGLEIKLTKFNKIGGGGEEMEE